MRKSYIVALRKRTFNKACYFCDCINNSYISKTILPKVIPKSLKLTFIVDEPLDTKEDHTYELTLTAITNNYAVFNSVLITGIYINKSVLPEPIPATLGIKLEDI